MRKLRFCSDSASDILALPGSDFAFAPMKIITADREFTDDSSLDTEEMTEFLNSYKGRSRTSCPNPNDWLAAFGDADDVVCITITGALSGSYNAACTARQLYESDHPGRRVFVLDTLSAGPVMTLLIHHLAKIHREGASFEALCDEAVRYLKSTSLVFMLRSLKNFANNGRVSPLVAKIVGIAGICIVGKAGDGGTLEPLHKCRGEVKSLSVLFVEQKKMGYNGGRVLIGHCRNSEAATRLREDIRKEFPEAEIEIHKLRGLCSFYAENGGLLVGFERK